MAIATEDFIKQIDDMSVLELNDLVKALEDHYGVSAAAAAVPMAVAGGEPHAAGRHPIKTTVKGATYHLLRIFQKGDLWVGEVILDI